MLHVSTFLVCHDFVFVVDVLVRWPAQPHPTRTRPPPLALVWSIRVVCRLPGRPENACLVAEMPSFSSMIPGTIYGADTAPSRLRGTVRVWKVPRKFCFFLQTARVPVPVLLLLCAAGRTWWKHCRFFWPRYALRWYTACCWVMLYSGYWRGRPPVGDNMCCCCCCSVRFSSQSSCVDADGGSEKYRTTPGGE